MVVLLRQFVGISPDCLGSWCYTLAYTPVRVSPVLSLGSKRFHLATTTITYLKRGGQVNAPQLS